MSAVDPEHLRGLVDVKVLRPAQADGPGSHTDARNPGETRFLPKGHPAFESGHADNSGDLAGDPQRADSPRKRLLATPFTWREPNTNPPREWIYGRHYIRRYVSVTVAAPGIGKTTLGTGEGLAIGSGKPVLGVTPAERGRVWMWNGEDPIDECERRVAAACIQYGVTRQDIEGWLFLDSGRDTEIVIATMTKEGTRISVPVVTEIIETIRQNRIDVMMIDPFVSSHRVSENDNMAIDAVTKKWAYIADVTGCAIELIHHARKTGGEEVTVEDARGGGALLGTVRSARVLNRMSEAEAKKAGLSEHRGFFRFNSGKVNMAPNPSKATWFQLVSVDLGNDTERYPHGDHVATAMPWAWPDLLENVAAADLLKVQREVDAAESLRAALSGAPRRFVRKHHPRGCARGCWPAGMTSWVWRGRQAGKSAPCCSGRS